jgi:hypothetical protein
LTKRNRENGFGGEQRGQWGTGGAVSFVLPSLATGASAWF